MEKFGIRIIIVINFDTPAPRVLIPNNFAIVEHRVGKASGDVFTKHVCRLA
jgi:hypothetical protein